MRNKSAVLLLLVFIYSAMLSNLAIAGTSTANAVNYYGTLTITSKSYGIDIIQKDNTHKKINFDSKGQKLAKDMVSKAKLKSGEPIVVKGYIKNNVLYVTSIARNILKEETFTGWLGDSDCTPNLDNPADMGVMCLKCPDCEKSGYGIAIKQKDGKYKYYKFDAAGHKLAKESIVDKTESGKVPKIIVKGTLSGNSIKVTSIALKK